MRSDRAGLPVDAALLETELPSKQRRASLLAWLLGMAEDRLAGRHCSEAQIKQQIIAWTTPCLSAFGKFEASLPRAGKDVTAVPGSVDLQPVEALARHLQIALIACALEARVKASARCLTFLCIPCLCFCVFLVFLFFLPWLLLRYTCGSVALPTVAGWRKLLDFSENAGVYDVAQRLLDLLTLRVARSWMEPCGFEDQADMIEAVLVILWGRKALVLHEHELRQRRGALDPGDMVYLRCLMRKYGWERRSNADSPCLWQEVFPKADYVAFAWFLLQELLHPRSATELTTLRELHQPAAVAAERASRRTVLRTVSSVVCICTLSLLVA